MLAEGGIQDLRVMALALMSNLVRLYHYHVIESKAYLPDDAINELWVSIVVPFTT